MNPHSFSVSSTQSVTPSQPVVIGRNVAAKAGWAAQPIVPLSSTALSDEAPTAVPGGGRARVGGAE